MTNPLVKKRQNVRIVRKRIRLATTPVEKMGQLRIIRLKGKEQQQKKAFRFTDK